MKNDFKSTERMITTTYWIVIILVVLFTLAFLGGCAWAVWILTKVVMA